MQPPLKINSSPQIKTLNEQNDSDPKKKPFGEPDTM